MKQTAVEFLIEELNNIKSSSTDQYYGKITFLEKEFIRVLDQAKEMEKEQQGYSKEKVDKLLDTLLHYNMCSVAGDELIEKFKNQLQG